MRTVQAPTIDGKLDDLSWRTAVVANHFTQRFPDEATPPSQQTEFRVLYDDEALYVGVRCNDTTPKAIVAQLTRRDRDVNVDRIVVDISSKNDKVSAYHFQVNAAGVQLDGIRFNDTDYNNDWDGRWYAATTIDDKGWSAELKIPLVTLRYGDDVSDFGFQLRRYLPRRGEIDEWAYIPSTARGEVSNYGTLRGINGLQAKRLFEVLVYDARRWTFRNRQGDFDGRVDGGSLGADLKLGLTPALTLDATINPDFGTVEVDQVVLNLTTVENYFPEKRPFFIEGADLFATPFTLFYSRRIGATPPDPTIGPLLEPVPAGRIHAALKMSGVLTGRLSIAVLDAVTARRDAVVERSVGETVQQLVDPTSNDGVLRLRQDFGTNSFIGAMATAVNRIEPADAAAPIPGDECPVPYSTDFISLDAPAPRNGRCTNDAYVGGLDAVLRTSDGEWGASAQVVGSRIVNGPTRFIPDGTTIGTGASGIGMNIEAGRYGGETWLFKLALRSASPRFQINDVGYQDVANFHDGNAQLTWRTTKPHGPLQAASISAEFQHRRTWDNLRLDLNPRLTVSLQLKNLWSVAATAHPYYPKWYENRETQDGARTERNHGYYANLDVRSDPNRAVVFNTFARVLKNYGGLTALRSETTISMRPVSTLEVDLLANVSWETGGPRWIETADNSDGTRSYYFADLDARSVDLTLRGTYTFSPKLSLQAYLQPFVASGRYSRAIASTTSGPKPTLRLDSFSPGIAPSGALPDFQTGAINVNVFLRYEYLPLSALWLVYTREQQQSPFEPMDGAARLRIDRFTNGPTTDVVLVKLSYLWY